MSSRTAIVELVAEWADFYWEPLRTAGPFDYDNPAYLNRATGGSATPKLGCCVSSR